LLITLLIAPGKVLAIFSDSINIKEAESIILDSMSGLFIEICFGMG